MSRPRRSPAPEGEEAPKKRRKRKLPKVITITEADRLLRAAASDARVHPDEAARNRLCLELMYRAGLRVSEVVNLAPRDILPDGVIRLYDAKGGDGTAYYDPERVLPLLEGWYAVRERWLAGGDHAKLFVKPNGDEMGVRYLQRLVKRLKEEVGITGICTPHVLRHSYATELLEEGLTITEVQSAMRHADLATTAVYLHVRDESLRRKIAGRGRRPRGGEA